MRSMSQGGTRCLDPAAEYNERAKWRSVKMQHVLPSRNVCVAYHGMTIPLPAPSLCGTFHKPLLIGKVNERGLKDSGFNSQATTVSEVSCSTASVSTSPGGAGLCSRQWKGDERKEEEEKIQVEKCDKSCKIEPALTYSASACCLSECISTETRYPTLLLPDKKAENPLSKSVWAGTGRGRALQQFVSQLTHRPAGISGAYDNGITDLRHCIKEAADAITRGGVIKAEHMSVAEDVDISCGSSVTSSSPVDQPSENIMIESRAVSDMKYEDPASPVELMGESNNTTESVDIMPSSVSCAEFGPEKEIEGQITTPVRTDESQPLLSRSISHVPHNSVTKTPSRSSRKSKVSLAIQFKGTCTLQSVSQRDSLLTLRPLEETPQGVMLCDLQSPSTRISEVAVKAEEVAAEEDPEEMAMVSETPDHTEGPVKDVGKKREECELKDGESPEVSGVEDRGQGPIDSYALSGSDVEVDSLESRVEETLGLSGHHLGLVRSLSSDEDMVECAEARMGRGANELEKSIALHQRNIHRNRLELKRVQRKNKATEEMLAGDLAEQCYEDLSRDDMNLQYSTTQERETRMDRVVDLHLQFSIDSEAVKRRSAGYVAIWDQGRTAYKNDKLAHMELQLEVEAMELEDQLMLEKMKSQLLQAKSELIYD